MTSSMLQPVFLAGRYVQLVPLEAKHRDDLVRAVQDGNLQDLWYTTAPSPDTMGAEIERRLALWQSGTMLPFAVIDPVTGDAVE